MTNERIRIHGHPLWFPVRYSNRLIVDVLCNETVRNDRFQHTYGGDNKMKRWNVYHCGEYQGFVIAKDAKKALDEAISQYGCHPMLEVKIAPSFKAQA